MCYDNSSSPRYRLSPPYLADFVLRIAAAAVILAGLKRNAPPRRPPVKQRSAEPRPRWEVLRVLNYLVITLFVCSITYVVFNYRTMSHAESGNGGLFPILVIW